MKHVVSLSGGKDSTAMLIKMLEGNWQVDEIVFCKIMATQNIGAELPEMYGYINKINNYIKLRYNKEIKILTQEKTFEDYFYTKKNKGKRKGQIYGFPFTISPWCNDRLKQKLFRRYIKDLGEDYTFYIGIASDEPKRLAKLTENQRAPLAEWRHVRARLFKFLKRERIRKSIIQ